MELILKEWIGAGNERVELLDSSIIDSTLSFYTSQSYEDKKMHYAQLNSIKPKKLSSFDTKQ